MTHVYAKGPVQRDNDALIVHLCQRNTWLDWKTNKDSKARGAYHAPSLDSEGFIHCSQADQILDVANAFYRNVPDLVLLWIDPNKVDAEIHWERAGDDTFPHIYGELNVEAVVEVSDLNLDADGFFRSF